VTEQSHEPVSLERARLLLGWLRAQRAVDNCLSELLAAGPAGERRVSRQIDRVTGLVSAAAVAFEAYSTSVRNSRDEPELANVTELRSVSLSAVDTVDTVETVSPLNH
jgi:hypothetical protein